MPAESLDVVVVGGGPGGLAAAFWLARYRRTVRVYDTGEPRNEPAWAVHGYPGLPDTPPVELRRRMREQAIIAGAEVVRAAVQDVTGGKGDFTVRLQDGGTVHAGRVVLAYGLQDLLPAVPGIDAFYGLSVYHCPDCDGPSFVGVPVGVIGWDRAAGNLALYLKTWASSTTLLAHGNPVQLSDAQRAVLARNDVTIVEPRIEELTGDPDEPGALAAARLADGRSVEMNGLFFHLGTVSATRIAEGLGCERDEDGYLRTDRSGQTTVPGVFAAGDLIGHPHLAVSAAAEGVVAALAIHRSLLPDDMRLPKE